jgi:hypothetical protein
MPGRCVAVPPKPRPDERCVEARDRSDDVGAVEQVGDVLGGEESGAVALATMALPRRRCRVSDDWDLVGPVWDLRASLVEVPDPKGVRIGPGEVDRELPDPLPVPPSPVAHDDGELPHVVALRVEPRGLTIDEGQLRHVAPFPRLSKSRPTALCASAGSNPGTGTLHTLGEASKRRTPQLCRQRTA